MGERKDRCMCVHTHMDVCVCACGACVHACVRACVRVCGVVGERGERQTERMRVLQVPAYPSLQKTTIFKYDKNNPPAMRTQDEIRLAWALKDRTVFKSQTALSLLPYLDLTVSIDMEELHDLDEGALAKLFTLWLDKRFSQAPHSLRRVQRIINECIGNTLFPFDLPYAPREYEKFHAFLKGMCARASINMNFVL